MELETKKFGGFTSLQVKIIICITMAIDHFALIFLPMESTAYTISRGIGRMALPLACFLLVEGFLATSKIRNYGLRLLIFACIAEAPWLVLAGEKMYELQLFFQEIGEEAYAELRNQGSYLIADRVLALFNVLFSLLIGLLLVWLLDKVKKHYGGYIPTDGWHNVKYVLQLMGLVFAAIAILVTFYMDYAAFVPLYVLVFYLWRDDDAVKLLMCAMMVLLNMQNLLFGIFGVLALLLVKFYNRELGYDKAKHPRLKYLFYVFYPAHLAIFLVVKYIIL